MEHKHTSPDGIDPTEVRQIISRLREIRRRQVKAVSTGSEEFIALQEHLETVISTLEAHLEVDAGPLDLRELRAQLGAVEHLCEGCGLVNVARVIGNVEQALMDLGSAAAADDEPPPPRRFRKPAASEDDDLEERLRPRPPRHEEVPELESPSHVAEIALFLISGSSGGLLAFALCQRSLGLGLFASTAVAVLAVLVVGTSNVQLLRLVTSRVAPVQDQRFFGRALLALVAVPWCVAGIAALALVLLPRATAPQTPRPISARRNPVPTRAPELSAGGLAASVPLDSSEELLDRVGAMMARVPQEIASAETALKYEDVDGALRHFSVAAAIDPHNRLVKEMAATLIDALLRAADGATEEGEWDLAAARVETARHLAADYYLDTARIDQTVRRHAAKVRFVDLTAGDVREILASVGRPVRVTLQTRETLSGNLEAFKGRTLFLDVHSGIGGGEVSFAKEIPLSAVHQLRVFEMSRGASLPTPPRP